MTKISQSQAFLKISGWPDRVADEVIHFPGGLSISAPGVGTPANAPISVEASLVGDRWVASTVSAMCPPAGAGRQAQGNVSRLPSYVSRNALAPAAGTTSAAPKASPAAASTPSATPAPAAASSAPAAPATQPPKPPAPAPAASRPASFGGFGRVAAAGAALPPPSGPGKQSGAGASKPPAFDADSPVDDIPY